jgi:hypothetical protein
MLDQRAVGRRMTLAASNKARLTVTNFCDAADPVYFTRLVSPRCQAEVGPDRSGSTEALGIIDCCPVDEPTLEANHGEAFIDEAATDLLRRRTGFHANANEVISPSVKSSCHSIGVTGHLPLP